MEWLLVIFPMIVDSFKNTDPTGPQYIQPHFGAAAQIKKSMPVADVIKQLGMPFKVSNMDMNPYAPKQVSKMLYYSGDMCIYPEASTRTFECHLMIVDGKVYAFDGLKPQYTVLE